MHEVVQRQLGVLFVDIVDSTSLCNTIGAERFHALMIEFLRCATLEVEVHRGFVARYMGDGLLAYFGFPEPSEDDSVRAIHAALGIQSAIKAISNEAGIPFQMRAGVASGKVMIGTWLGEGAARELPVGGDVAILAARLQAAAAPDSILVSELTSQLARSAFRFDQPKSLKIKGFPEPVQAYGVKRATGLEHRPWAADESGAIVARVAELGRMQSVWCKAERGGVQGIFLQAEAGLGKTKLVSAFLETLGTGPVHIQSGAASPVSKNLPLFLMGQIWESGPRSGVSDDGLESFATTVEGALDQILRQAPQSPRVIVAEDLHWADPSSLQVLVGLLRSSASGTMLVCTSRAARPAELDGSDLETIQLGRLSDTSLAEIIGPKSRFGLAADVAARLAERADGFPLFCVELARHFSSQGTSQPSSLPWTLSEFLASRLADLNDERHLIECLAVLGTQADLLTVSALADYSMHQAQTMAFALRRAGLIWQTQSQGETILAFAHAFLRETVYDLMTSQRRQSLNRRAAEVLTTRPGVSSQYDNIAGHWSAAGEALRAAAAYAEAGRTHARRFSFREAEVSVNQGITMLETLPASPERDSIELDLQSTLASTLQINLGYSTEKALLAARRAQFLAERQGQLIQRFGALAGHWMATSSAGDYQSAASTARELLAIARSIGGEELPGVAWMANLTASFRLGDLIGAETAFVSGSESFHTGNFTRIPGAVAQTFGNAALVAVLTGGASNARTRAAFALRNSRRLGSTYDLCFAAYMTGMVCLLLGATKMARRWGLRAQLLADKFGYPQFAAIAKLVIGRASAALGDGQASLSQMRDGIEAMKATQSRAGMTLYLGWLAEVQSMTGDHEGAASTIDQAIIANPDERFYKPELLRLRALILKQANLLTQARQALQEATADAEAMGATWHLDRISITRALIRNAD